VTDNQAAEHDLLSQVRLLAFEGLIPAAQVGEPPDLAWLPLAQLAVDGRYQRKAGSETSKALIRRIAENFDWRKFAPIVVAKSETRADRYLVIDGQHRCLGAAAHGGIEMLPCWVVAAAQVKEQAGVFIGVNRDRSIVQPLSLYRAALAAGDAEALAIDECCRAAGVTVVYALTMKGGKTELPPRATQAVSTLKQQMQRHGAPIVTAALSVLAEAYPAKPNQLRGSMISAVAEVLVKHGERVDRVRLAKVLSDRDANQLAAAAKNVKELLSCSTTAAMAEALIRDYDKGLPDVRRIMPPRAADATRAPAPLPVSTIEPPSRARLMAGR